MGDYAKLEFWFSDLDQKIDDYDIRKCSADIQLRALKVGISYESPEVIADIRALKEAAKIHNEPYIKLEQLEDAIRSSRNKVVFLDGTRQPKNSKERKYLEHLKYKFGLNSIDDLKHKLDELVEQQNENPVYKFSQLVVETKQHPQVLKMPNKTGWAHIDCAGGCGRFIEMREHKIYPAKFYVCDSTDSGHHCQKRLPSPKTGEITSFEFNAAGPFKGITYKWPTPAQEESMARAHRIALAAFKR